MADEKYTIEITDRLTTATADKLRALADAADRGATSVARLQSQINRLGTSRLDTAINRTTIQQQRLATETQRTAQAQINARAASARLSAEQSRAATAALKYETALNRVNAASGNMADSLSHMVSYAASLAGLVLPAVQLADAYVNLQNKLQNVVTSQEQVGKITAEMIDLANRSRVSVESATTAFSRFDKALEFLGKSQQDSIRFTETISKGLIVSGATAQETRSTLIQLSQALNAGRLNGQEFNSVSEHMRILLEYLAKSMGVNMGQLKKLGSQGKITSAEIYKAVELMRNRVEFVFKNMTPTIGQSFEVLRNKAIAFFGQLNEQTGFLTGITKAMLALGDNMQLVGTLAMAAGTAIAFYLGAVAWESVSKLGRAMQVLNATMMRNPIIALAAAAATLAVVISGLGDEIIVSADNLLTLGDYGSSAFSMLKEAASSTWAFIVAGADSLVAELNKTFPLIGNDFNTAMGQLIDYAISGIDLILGLFIGAIGALGVLWDKFGSDVKFVFNSIVGWAKWVGEGIVNIFVDSFNLINKGIDTLLGRVTNDLIPTLQRAGESGGAGLVDGLKAEFEKSLNAKYFSNFLKQLTAGAYGASAVRIDNAQQKADTQLRGVGVDQTLGLAGKDDGKAAKAAAKAAEKRATALAKVNAQLDNELARLAMLQPEREKQAKFDQIEEQMIGKKIKLTASEIASIKDKIAAIQDGQRVQAQMDTLYSEAIDPLLNYNTALKASSDLLKQGVFSAEKHATVVANAKKQYEESTDALAKYNTQIKESSRLFGLTPPASNIEAQIIQAENEALAKNQPLQKSRIDALRSQLEASQDMAGIQSQLDTVYYNSAGAIKELTNYLKALSMAYEQHTISQEYYRQQLVQTEIALANLKNQLGLGDIGTIGLGAFDGMLSGFTTAAAGVTTALSDMFQSLTTGVSNAFATVLIQGGSLKQLLGSLAQTVATSLLSSLINVGIQFAVNKALGEAMATGTAATQVAGITAISQAGTAAMVELGLTSAATGGAVATAWAPAAAAVSLATLGANSIPATAAIGATAAFAKVTLSPVAGFKTGGYTGNLSTNSVAGVVHGQEYVVNAAATAKYRPYLEAMNDGSFTGASGGYLGAANNLRSASFEQVNKMDLSINIENYGSSKDFEVQQLDEGQVRIIARDVAEATVREQTPRLVASEISNPNSYISKSLGKNTQTQRKRS